MTPERLLKEIKKLLERATKKNDVMLLMKLQHTLQEASNLASKGYCIAQEMKRLKREAEQKDLVQFKN